MNAYELISRLDDARNARRVSEDTTPVAPAPSHAPTSGKDYTTKGQGKSEDEGEPIRKGYKQPTGDIPAPVAAPPSHAPTSGKDYTTSGQGKSEDEGEKVSKEAMKEAVERLLDGDGSVEDLLDEAHKPGCQCGFCKNKGKFGKKADGEDKPKDGEKPLGEAGFMPRRPTGRPMAPMGRPSLRGRTGAGASRMSFRHQMPRPKAAINPNQPAMERLDTAGNAEQAIQEMADRLLEAPDLG